MGLKEFLYCKNCGSRFDAEEIAGTQIGTLCADCRPALHDMETPKPMPAVKAPAPARPKSTPKIPAAGVGKKSNPRLPVAQPGKKSTARIPALGPAPGRKSTRSIPTVKAPGGKKSSARIPIVGGRAMPPGPRTKSSPHNRAASGHYATAEPAKPKSPWPMMIGIVGATLVVAIVAFIALSGDTETAKPRAYNQPPPPPPKQDLGPASNPFPAGQKPTPAPAPVAAKPADPTTAPKPVTPETAPSPVPKKQPESMTARNEKNALAAIEKARAFAKANPDDINGQIRAWDEAVRNSALTSHFGTAKKERAAILSLSKTNLPGKLAALADQAKPSLDQEVFHEAIALYEKARSQESHPDWQILLTNKIQDIRKKMDELLAAVKKEAATARGKGDENDVARLTERVQKWGFPHLTDSLTKHMATVPMGKKPVAAAKPAPKKPAPKKPAPAKPKPKPKTPAPAPAKKPSAPASATEFALLPAQIAGTGKFKKMERPGAGLCWSVAADYGSEHENGISFAFEPKAGAAYKMWAYVGACCDETFAATYQATGTAGAEPGGAKSAALEIKPKGVKAEHIDHGGPKKPQTWLWVPVPLPEKLAEGTTEVRIYSPQKGFSVAAIFVSADSEAPPAFKDLAK